MRMVRFIPLAACAGLILAPVAAPLGAQGVTYTSVSSVKAGGAMGMILRMAGASNMTSTTYIAGHKMRTDSKDISTIIDADGARFTTVHHKQKTYTTMTFEEMRQLLDSAYASAKAERAKQKEKAKDASAKDKDYEMDYTVKAEPTSQHEKIAGYDARREFITVSMSAHEKGQEARPDQGAMVVLLDSWNSTSAPQVAAMREFQRAYAAKMKEEFTRSSPLKILEAAFGSDQRMKSALGAAAKEMAKIQGVPLRSTTYFVGVGEGATFDRDKVIASADKADAEAKADDGKPAEKKKGGLFGKLKAAAEAAAEKGSEKAGETKQAPAQGTLMSVVTEVQEIRSGVPGDAFAIPAGYREVPNELRKNR